MILWNNVLKPSESMTSREKMLFLMVFVYPLLFIFQGGDLTDSGFFAMSYQNFFPNLQLGETNSISILSDFIGATWFTLFPNSGILGLKILNLLFLYSVIGMTYLTLKDITNKRVLLIVGIFCGVVFATRWSPLVLGRDSVSWFFLVLTSFFLIKGLNPKKYKFLIISGLIYVFATLSRFPNIIFILLLPFLLVYTHINSFKELSFKLFWQPIKQYLLFVVGAIISLSTVLLIFNYLNIYDIFIKNFDVVGISAESTDSSSYSMLNLLENYLLDGIQFLPHLLAVVSLALTTSLLYEYSFKIKKNIPFIIFVLLLIGTALFVYKGYSYGSKIKYFVPAFCIVPLFISLINKDKFSALVALFSVLTLTQVAGTNTGLFLKLTYGFIVLFPLAILILTEKKLHQFENIKLHTKPILIIGISFVLFFSLVSRIAGIYHVDSGITSRLRFIHPIEHPKMKGIFTTKENSTYITQLSNLIDKHLDQDKNLFIYGHQPMFYYLTETIPPVKKFWLTNNYVQVDELFASLDSSIKSTGKYPMIVDTKQNIMGEAGQIRLELFLIGHGYKSTVKTENFDIWTK